MDDLAAALEAEAACLWHDWAGALVAAAASCVAGEDGRLIRALPDAGGRPNGIVVQRGHVVDIGGGSIPQLLRLGGAAAVEVGAVDRCEPAEVGVALHSAAAGLFVAPSRPEGLVALAPFAWRCRQAGRPAIVLLLDGGGSHVAALDAGADLVVLDGASLGGPPCGIVAGAGPLVGACRLQDSGVGRALRARAGDAALLARALGREGDDG